MDKHYTYLLINFLTLFFPVILSFDRKVSFSKSWKFISPGLLITGGLFLIWDYIFTLYDVWSFNPDYVIGVYFLNLPIEEILFFITVPFACIFIYECLNFYIKRDILRNASTAISITLLALSGIMLLLFYNRVYSLITFALLSILSGWVLFKKPRYISRFYLAYLVSLIPFYVVNGLLTSIPVVIYSDAQNSGFRVGTIPFEDHFYSLSMLLMNVLFFEYFRSKQSKD
ncbi:MAG: lycopene cyclase domain-containing protein [Pyrinomonadaceae bacterium]|nr:lycopene cyclase domain-containing protein [Sphingobacteriaceae bacterium]